MRNLIPVAAALMLAGCANTDLSDQFKSAAEIVQKGKDIQDKAAQKLAVGFDAYCGKTPTVARSYVRGVVNQALANMNSPWRASDFCQKVE